MNYKDYTLKAKVTDMERIEEGLKSAGAYYEGLDHQTDYYFQTGIGKLKYRKGTIEHLITHYQRKIVDGMERTTVYRYDKNPTEDQINHLRSTSKQIGVTQKERRIFTLENIKIHVDKLPDGRCYLEIEAIDRTGNFTEEDLRAQCLDMKSKLGIGDEDLVGTGYLDG